MNRKITQPKLKRFGWCVDNHHESCRIEYTDWNNKIQVCECKCHTKKKKVK